MFVFSDKTIFLQWLIFFSLAQDLTFVQIGNPDLIDGKINFAKRWQQFNILVSIIKSEVGPKAEISCFRMF